jgi:hypothetical protein
MKSGLSKFGRNNTSVSKGSGMGSRMSKKFAGLNDRKRQKVGKDHECVIEK